MFIKINNIVCNLNSISISDSGSLFYSGFRMDINKNQHDALIDLMSKANLYGSSNLTINNISIFQKNLIEANCNINIVGLN